MASLQSNLPFHSNTTRQARHGQLAEQIYLFIAKNRHVNIVLQAELYLRTGTYDRPKNTLAIDSACAPLDSALAIDAPGAVEPHG